MDEILNLIESVSEGFPSYFSIVYRQSKQKRIDKIFFFQNNMISKIHVSVA